MYELEGLTTEVLDLGMGRKRLEESYDVSVVVGKT